MYSGSYQTLGLHDLSLFHTMISMHVHIWKIGHHRKDMTIFGNKRSDMVPGGTADAAEWLQSVRSSLMAMRWAFESSKSIK